jgi:hypothetical protein
MSAFSVAPSCRFSSPKTIAVLLPTRAAELGVVCFVALTSFVATDGACAPSFGARFWMAFQIRVAATWRLVNFRTGLTPGKLFQISIKREADHFRATLSSSFLQRAAQRTTGRDSPRRMVDPNYLVAKIEKTFSRPLDDTSRGCLIGHPSPHGIAPSLLPQVPSGLTLYISGTSSKAATHHSGRAWTLLSNP